MRKVTLFLGLALLAACGSDDPAAAPTKNLFNVWTRTDNTVVFDLSGGQIGSTTMAIEYTSGEICTFNVAIGGDGFNGTAIVTGGTYISGGAGDPGCAGLNNSYDYAISAANILTLCVGASCVTYD